MDVSTFYALFSATCFTLLGLWWSVVQRHEDRLRFPVAAADHRFDAGAARGDEGELGGDEHGVQQDEDDDDEQLDRRCGHERFGRRLPPSAASGSTSATRASASSRLRSAADRGSVGERGAKGRQPRRDEREPAAHGRLVQDVRAGDEGSRRR